jgi:D-alanyl-D-alanine carboxypeptidase
VIDVDTDEVLHARNADEARYPASLTKVMTLYMLFDAMKAGDVSLNERLPVSRFAASQAPSSLKLKPGSHITVKDAIGAIVTKSANDVAVVIAERLGGTESRFAQLMTIKARSLGLEHTTFVNASGLPDSRQITTARDLAVLAEAMLSDHADYYHYFSNPRFAWGGKTYKNHNELLGTVDGVDGIKTGYTRASGFNLMTSAKRDGHRIVAIMLGGSTSKSRNAHVEALVEAAFDALQMPVDPANPALRTDLAFAAINNPVNPNGAAEPMLNGQRLSVITAANIAPPPSVRPAPVLMATVEAPVEPVQEEEDSDEEILVADLASASDADIEQGDATPTNFAEATVIIPAGRPAFSISEYESRQLQR